MVLGISELWAQQDALFHREDVFNINMNITSVPPPWEFGFPQPILITILSHSKYNRLDQFPNHIYYPLFHHLTSTMSSSTSINKFSAEDNSYRKSGIGGVGNCHKSSGARAIPTPRITVTQSSGLFSIGIGGAGNVRDCKDRSVITHEELISCKMIIKDSTQQHHHGIGGAGNSMSSSMRELTSISLSSSTSSDTSARFNGSQKLKEKFGGIWKRGTPADSLSLLSSSNSFGEMA